MAPAYDFFGYTIYEKRHEGIEMATPSGPATAASEFVRWSAAYAVREVRWVVAARGDQPDAPAAASLAGNYKLLTSEINANNPIPIGKGVYLWILHGTYWYGLARPRPTDTDFPIGSLPPSVDRLGPSFRYFQRSKFKRFLESGGGPLPVTP